MLILSRKMNQQICVGDNISITVVSVSGSRVKLGIDAPESVKIIRSELVKRNSSSQIPEDRSIAENQVGAHRSDDDSEQSNCASMDASGTHRKSTFESTKT